MPKSLLATSSFLYNQGRQACTQGTFLWLKLVMYTEIQSGYEASICTHKGANTEVQQHSEAGLDTALQVRLSRREGSSLHTCWKHSSHCSPRCRWASLGQRIFPAQGQVLAAELLPSWAAPALPTGLLLFPRSRTWLFSLLNFVGGLTAHFSSLSWSLWPVRYTSQLDLQMWWGALIMMSEPRLIPGIHDWWLVFTWTSYTDLQSLSPDTHLSICFTVCTSSPHLISISMKTVSKALLISRSTIFAAFHSVTKPVISPFIRLVNPC